MSYTIYCCGKEMEKKLVAFAKNLEETYWKCHRCGRYLEVKEEGGEQV